ncbi:MAG TPA: hypothetical protein P5081_04345 [Phycisphaerae bacterium]|nr:hypothetical protein [Phycisphaerae bacterium]HRW52091.1 hypothetical protein [Phycisphaerae bacterium]
MSQQEWMLILQTAVAPLVLGFAIASAIGFAMRHRDPDRPVGDWPGVVAIGLAALTGQLWFGGLHWPQRLALVEAWQWIVGFAITAILLLPVSNAPKAKAWLGDVIRIALFALATFFVVRALAVMERSTAIRWMIMAPIACGAWATALSRIGPQVARRLWPCILAIVLTLSAVTLFLTGSLTHFALLAALAAATGGVFFSQLTMRARPALVANAGGSFSLLFFAGLLLVHALYVDDVPFRALGALMIAPFGVLVGLIPGLRTRHPRWAIALQIATTLAIAACALVPVILNYEPDPYAGY